MIVACTLHRFIRDKSRWIDTAITEADGVAGLLVQSDHDIEATLVFGAASSEQVMVRDVVWPLVWRLCLQPVIAVVGEGQGEWRYRCFSSRTTITLRAEGERVWVRRDEGPEAGFAAAELWAELVAIGERVVTLAERDGEANARNVELLRPALEQARGCLRGR